MHIVVVVVVRWQTDAHVNVVVRGRTDTQVVVVVE